jgi:surface antigen
MSVRRLSLFLLLLAFAFPVISSMDAQAAANDCQSDSYACTPGYTGSNASTSWAWKYYGGTTASTSSGVHNCTMYVAWRLAQNGMTDPGRSWGNAYEWMSRIGGGNHTPTVGSIAWWGLSSSAPNGHVAYVEQVSGSSIFVRSDNWSASRGYTTAGWILVSSVDQFLHPFDATFAPGNLEPGVRINSDSRADLVVSRPGGGFAVAYANDNGTLSEGPVSLTNWTVPTWAGSGDFNGDTFTDILVAQPSGGFALALGHANGIFTEGGVTLPGWGIGTGWAANGTVGRSWGLGFTRSNR